MTISSRLYLIFRAYYYAWYYARHPDEDILQVPIDNLATWIPGQPQQTQEKSKPSPQRPLRIIPQSRNDFETYEKLSPKALQLLQAQASSTFQLGVLRALTYFRREVEVSRGHELPLEITFTEDYDVMTQEKYLYFTAYDPGNYNLIARKKLSHHDIYHLASFRV